MGNLLGYIDPITASKILGGQRSSATRVGPVGNEGPESNMEGTMRRSELRI